MWLLSEIIEFINGKRSMRVSGKVEVESSEDKPLNVQLKGSLPAIWGSDISERPPADEVTVGQQFIVANENLDAWVSNGTDWVVI